jgi:7,8-dihydro-6-hydroxymethylpterin dimethyltransferase
LELDLIDFSSRNSNCKGQYLFENNQLLLLTFAIFAAFQIEVICALGTSKVQGCAYKLDQSLILILIGTLVVYLTKDEISEWQPYALPDGNDGLSALNRTKKRLQLAGQWAPWQMIGRRMAIGCVALEITQRCNLDCSYCYLSEYSEALKDIPLEEVYRRIDLIFDHYGENTDVQVTGGDPTLRNRQELVAIIQYIRKKRMRSSLFTNGIKASRDLLAELCAAGLEDVAFHVDMTQERKGYANEIELNAVRDEYIERVRGLPLAVIFNTTAYPGNFHEIPELVKYFVRRADVVRFASFQVGADMGRGTERERVTVNPATVMQAIRQGADANLNFDAASAGHAKCNGYAYGLVINGRVHDFFNDPDFVRDILASSAHLTVDRANKTSVKKTVMSYFINHPATFWGVVTRFAKLVWKERSDFFAARGKVGKISFFVHNFMDSSQLEKDRCDACSFMVMTPQGPMSMCVHNAKRDDYLLVAAQVKRENKVMFFNPVSGQLEDNLPLKLTPQLSRKNARGRAKEGLVSE